MSTSYKELFKEYFNDYFFKKINYLKIGKGFLNDTEYLKILGFTFILVDVDNCISDIVDEKELETKEAKIVNFSNIIILLNTQTKYAQYWNHNYEFIGIFNKGRGDSNIEFDSIAISSISITSDFCAGHYNRDLIDNLEIVFKDSPYGYSDNPFSKYLEKTIRPIRKALRNNFSKEMKSYCYLETDNIMNSFSLQMKRCCEPTISEFSNILREVKLFDTNITDNLCNRIFRPEDYCE